MPFCAIWVQRTRLCIRVRSRRLWRTALALNANPAGFFAYAVNFACAYRKSVTGITTHPMRWFDLRTAMMS